MLSVRKSILTAFLAATIIQPAFASRGGLTVSIRGSLLGSTNQATQRMTAADTARMEEARQLVLNTDQGEVSWVGDGAFKGNFKIEKRYTIKDSTTSCASYVHTLSDKTTNQVVTEQEIGKEPRPLAIRGWVCLENGQWNRYRGDKQLLIPVTANTPIAATPTASQPTAPPRVSAVAQLPPTGPVGTDHSDNFPNVMGRTKLGEIVHSFKVMEVQLDEKLEEMRQAEPTANINAKFREQTEKIWAKARANGWINEMNRVNRYIAMDQLALILKELKTESAKFEVVSAFAEHGRIDARAGDKSSVTAQFNSGTKESTRLLREVRKMLVNRD